MAIVEKILEYSASNAKVESNWEEFNIGGGSLFNYPLYLRHVLYYTRNGATWYINKIECEAYRSTVSTTAIASMSLNNISVNYGDGWTKTDTSKKIKAESFSISSISSSVSSPTVIATYSYQPGSNYACYTASEKKVLSITLLTAVSVGTATASQTITYKLTCNKLHFEGKFYVRGESYRVVTWNYGEKWTEPPKPGEYYENGKWTVTIKLIDEVGDGSSTKEYYIDWKQKMVFSKWNGTSTTTDFSATAEFISSGEPQPSGTSQKVTLPTPKATGYKFTKWTDKDGKAVKDVTLNQKGDTDLEYTANWEGIPYILEYVCDNWKDSTGKDIPHDKQIKRMYGDTDKYIQLNIPYKTGYKFNGWKASNGKDTKTVLSPGSKITDYFFDDGNTVKLNPVFSTITHTLNMKYYLPPSGGSVRTLSHTFTIEDVPTSFTNPESGNDWTVVGWWETMPEGWNTSKGFYKNIDDAPGGYLDPNYEIIKKDLNTEEWDRNGWSKDIYALWNVTGKYIKVDNNWYKVGVSYIKVDGKWQTVELPSVKYEGRWYSEIK